MKKSTLILALAMSSAIAFTSCSSSTESTETATEETPVIADGSYAINNEASMVTWKGTMLGVKSHEGTLGLSNASVDVSNGAVTGGTFEIDLATITPTDDAYNEKQTKEKLVGHLSSPDFFNVSEFPTATFTVTGSEGDKVMGNLTVRGITNPETVENVVIMDENGSTVMTGDLTFDRKKYEVSFDTGAEDMIISDDIEVSVKLVAAK